MATQFKFKVRVSGDKFRVILYPEYPEVVVKDNLTEQEAMALAEKCNKAQKSWGYV